MASDPLLRATKRAGRCPPGSRCAVCGESERLVPPQAPGEPVLCLNHHRQRRGVTHLDIAHVARRRSWASLTVLMPTSANDRIEEMRRDLDLEAAPDPLGAPLLILADYLEGRAFIDLIYADYWRHLDAYLKERCGDRYWEGGPQPPIV